MACPAGLDNLSIMYPITQRARVRDRGARYGDQPVPTERFAGEAALRDLRGAPMEEVPLIVARYVAVRAWAMVLDRAEAGPHAVAAATAHLETVDPAWAERPLLQRLVAGKADGRIMERAAALAGARGHVAGAGALRVVGRLLRRDEGSPPGGS